MTKEQIEAFESKLLGLGYSKVTVCKHSEEDWDMYLAVPDEDWEIKYQIIYRFWDFEQFRIGEGYSVDVVILLDEPFDRVDLQITDSKQVLIVDRIERLAKEFYKFMKGYGKEKC